MDKDEGTTPIVRILTSVRFWRIERQVLGLCWLLTLTLSDADVQCSGVKRRQPGARWPVTLPFTSCVPWEELLKLSVFQFLHLFHGAKKLAHRVFVKCK